MFIAVFLVSQTRMFKIIYYVQEPSHFIGSGALLVLHVGLSYVIFSINYYKPEQVHVLVQHFSLNAA